VGAAIRDGFKDVLAGWGIRPLQYVILLVLDAGGGLSQQELCVAARVDSGNMVELLDGLEARQYAQRPRDPGTAGGTPVVPSIAGRALDPDAVVSIRFTSVTDRSYREQLWISRLRSGCVR
jgi:DNA-binding MarR family transcriptional regulator